MSNIADLHPTNKTMIDKDFIAIGSRIYRLRHERGWSQADLAAEMNTDQQVVSRYEQDREGRMSLSKVALFAQAFGVTPYELIGMEVPESVIAKTNAINEVKAGMVKVVEPETLTQLVALVA